ncbi:uncharacterized protein LOC135573437, partial [Oncorhynchus nerka]|uniref:uncharacterized protein LOC135573437 n=1 Tax=Oncorhynchus nerka TaxID=8023 RepID=UPI0031B80E56
NPYHLVPVGSQTGEEQEEDKEKEGRYVVRERDGKEEEPGWEKRYGKIWVELEKREVKSSYRNVAAELKQKFGKLPAESASDETTEEEKQEENVEIVESPARTTEEESSNEEVGEPNVCLLSRARRSSSNAVLLTILEQRGSGLEDSLNESADNSLCEDRTQHGDTPGSPDLSPSAEDSEMGDLELLCGIEPENSSALPQLFGEIDREREVDYNVDDVTKTFTDCNAASVELKLDNVHMDSSLNKGESNPSPDKDATTKPKPAAEERWPGQVQQGDETSPSMYEEEPEVCPSQSQPSSLSNVCPPAPLLPSDEELEKDLQRFKHEVGMLKVVFLDLEKEKALLWKEVEDYDCPRSRYSPPNSFLFCLFFFLRFFHSITSAESV